MALSTQTPDFSSKYVLGPNIDGFLHCILLQGMKRFHARVEVVKKLKELGLFVETKDNPMQIPICRCESRLPLYADLTFM